MQKSHISLVGVLFELVGERCLCTTRNHTTTTLLYTLRLTKLMEHGSLYHSTHSHGSRTGGMICGRNDLLETISGNECVARYPYTFYCWLITWIVTLDFRYKTEIMCLAARIISAIRDRARKKSMGNTNGVFDAIHIRSKFDFG